MEEEDAAHIQQCVFSNNHCFGTIAAPSASLELFFLPDAVPDALNNLDVGDLPMDRLKIILIQDVFRRSRREGFDWAIQLEFHVAFAGIQ
jgi:hypothetical protein